jgi:predicted nucleic acid-binding protein
MDQWAKKRYLDTSALVKLVIDEGGHQEVRSFFYSDTNFCSTSLCLAEALGVIKNKWNRSLINEEQYFNATRELIISAWGQKIEVNDIDLFTPESQKAVEELARKHKLDLSDALQLETIKQGTYSHLGPNSASVLSTADKKLAEAAKAEGIRSWNCITSSVPDWV